MKVIAKLNNLRVSPRKVRDSADLVRGCNVSDALYKLENTVRRSNESLIGLINSAIANAENNFGLNRDDLYISEITVNEGVTLKRWMPRAYGRATQILKRTSKVKVVLEGSKKEGEAESKPKKKVEKKETKKVPTEGSEKTKEKVVKKKEGVSREFTKNHKKIEGSQSRVLSRQPGTAKKIFKKTSDKK